MFYLGMTSNGKLWVFVILIIGSLIVDQATSYPYGVIRKEKITKQTPERIQYFVILTETFGITTKFPLILHGKQDFCLQTNSESGDYCILIKNDIIYPSRDMNLAIFEIEGEFYFEIGLTSVASLRLDLVPLDFDHFQFTAELPITTIDNMGSYNSDFVKEYRESIVYNKIEKAGFTTITKDDIYLNFTRYVAPDDKELIICPMSSGLPLWGDFSVVGLFTFTSKECVADMKHCSHSCEYLNKDNNKISFLSLLNKDVIAAVKKYIPDYL